MSRGDRFLALTGGVGGAKLAVGLCALLGPEELSFVVNTGDDFEHLGLHVSPDLDSLMYALADLSNPDTGWGRRGETWHFIDTLRELGGESWFRLGDRDLAVHVQRSVRLREGASLSCVTRELNAALGTRHAIWPMSDDRVSTIVHTADGPLAFQHYFVRERCAPRVTGFEFAHAASAKPLPAVLELLADPALTGIILCPSNPFVSIDPILAVPGMRAALRASAAPVVAVSPIVAGLALKGPTAKMMAELRVPTTATAVAAHYGDLLDGFVLDAQDAPLLAAFNDGGPAAIAAPSVMLTFDDKLRLATIVVEFVRELRAVATRR
ncbi:MAG TPA: 2-phospho-L-lactate transferase [Gammaproteobacteria bacterium]|nr:2-phospho-L-lactate transferase [Gammaproteobacteria bacterium]